MDRVKIVWLSWRGVLNTAVLSFYPLEDLIKEEVVSNSKLGTHYLVTWGYCRARENCQVRQKCRKIGLSTSESCARCVVYERHSRALGFWQRLCSMSVHRCFVFLRHQWFVYMTTIFYVSGTPTFYPSWTTKLYVYCYCSFISIQYWFLISALIQCTSR